MFPTWRLKLREVRVAADSGRYEDAIALLERESLCEFLPAKRLAQEVAGKMVARARERFDGGDSAAAWQDLVTADRLGGQDQAIDQLRQQYADRALAEVRRFLAAGEASAALARLEKLHSKGLSSAPARRYQQIAASLSEAQQSGGHRRFFAGSRPVGAGAKAGRSRQMAPPRSEAQQSAAHGRFVEARAVLERAKGLVAGAADAEG